MNPTRTRLVGIASALSAIAIAAPVSTAGAATAAHAVTLPVAGQSVTVIGPKFITTAPSTFINTNNQVSFGGSTAGAQVAP